jgi:hypothetical protein
MISYSSRSGKDSGVVGYNVGRNYITVQFNNGVSYKYTNESAGKHVIKIMKQLAAAQTGLSTFISQYAPDFELKC